MSMTTRTETGTSAIPLRFGKWDSLYLDSVRLRQPFARHLREQGHDPKAIASATRQLPRIKARLAALTDDEHARRQERRCLLIGIRQEIVERLRKRKSSDIGSDLRLLGSIDRDLASLPRASAKMLPTSAGIRLSGALAGC